MLAVGLHEGGTVTQLLENCQHLLVGLPLLPILVQLYYVQQLLQTLLHHRILPIELGCCESEL